MIQDGLDRDGVFLLSIELGLAQVQGVLHSKRGVWEIAWFGALVCRKIT